jgi:CIC family chloride channel protein
MFTEDNVTSKKFQVQMVIYAFFIGLIAGVVAIVFHYLVRVGTQYFSGLYQQASYFRILIPVIITLFFVFSHHYLLKDETKFGVLAVKSELDMIDRRLMIPHLVFVKLMNAVLALSTGFAVGQFGPTVHIGGAIGSNVGYYLKVPPNVVRLMIGCGVAGALSAVMHAPLFATLIVVEVLFAKRYFDYIVPILLSSVIAFSVDKLFFGDYTFLAFPEVSAIEHYGFSGWLAIIVVAILMGLSAAVYIIALRRVSNWMKVTFSATLQLVLVGLLTGVIAYFMPETLYTRLDILTISNGSLLTIGGLVLFMLLRYILTTVQLGSGICGGNFTPGLLIGLIFSVIIHRSFIMMGIVVFELPHIMLLSVVGMLSGFSHAPLAAIVLALELTGSIELLIPILTVALIGHFVSDFLVSENVYMAK